MSASSEKVFSDVPIEDVQQYWNERPCNIRHSTEPVGTREYFNQVEKRKYKVEPHIPHFAQFKRWKGKKVLEIGCGIGTDTINFARAGAMVTAVELSVESLNVAKERAKVFGFEDRITFYHANAEQLSDVVPVEAYDLIYSFGVIHHTPHPEKAIEELLKYTNPNTTLKLMLYYRWSWKVFWILLTYGKCQFWKLDEWIARHSEAQTGCPVTYSYDRNSVRKLLKGFKVTKTQPEHIFPYSIPEYKRYEYKKVWYFRYMPIRFFRLLERIAGWHLLIEARPA